MTFLKRNAVTIFLLSIIFTSCQKGYSPDGLVTPRNGTGSGSVAVTGALLVKTETNTEGSTEGVVKTFAYNASKQITRIETTVTDNSNKSISYYYDYVRDTDGKITQIKTNLLVVLSPSAGFPDIFTINVHYPAGSSNFDYTASSYSIMGFTVSDSVAYKYSNNKVSVSENYKIAGGNVYLPISETQYTYTGNNISTVKLFDPNKDLIQSTVFKYDNKTAALAIGNEALLFGFDPGFASVNNPEIATVSVPSNSLTIGYALTYQYNSADQPTSGTVIETPVAKTKTLKYTYQ